MKNTRVGIAAALVSLAVGVPVALRTRPPLAASDGAGGAPQTSTNPAKKQALAPASPPPWASAGSAGVALPSTPIPSERQGDRPLPPAYPAQLARLQQKLPGNLYWHLDAPTDDAQLLAQRDEEQHYYNRLFGKVQSNTATEEELREHFSRRRAVSEDYLALARALLEENGDDLPETDRGLLELSVQLHKARLAALPREEADARARSREHAARRAAFRAQQGRRSTP